MKEIDRDFINESAVYNNILNHRRNCEYWQNGTLCLECFGGGLTKFTEDLVFEFKQMNEIEKYWDKV